MAFSPILGGVRYPGQHDCRHQRMAACTLHIVDELGRVAVTDLGVVEIFKVPVVGSVVGEELPVVARGSIPSPAHHAEAAIGDSRRILRISSSVYIRTDRMAI